MYRRSVNDIIRKKPASSCAGFFVLWAFSSVREDGKKLPRRLQSIECMCQYRLRRCIDRRHELNA